MCVFWPLSSIFIFWPDSNLLLEVLLHLSIHNKLMKRYTLQLTRTNWYTVTMFANTVDPVRFGDHPTSEVHRATVSNKMVDVLYTHNVLSKMFDER